MDGKMSRNDKIFILLTSIFISLLIISNIIAGKIIKINNLIGPAAVLCYALTFVITDTIGELWGKERTKYVVTLGFFSSVIAAIMIKLALLLPAAPFWENQNEFELILGNNIRIVLASMVAYLVSQYHDIWAFHFWKDITKGKHLWIRNNLSTCISQLIDTAIFITIAFYGTNTPLLNLILGQYALKLIIAICDTPLVYFLVKIIKKYDTLIDKNSVINRI